MQYRDIAFLCGYFSVKNGNPNDIFASQGGFWTRVEYQGEELAWARDFYYPEFAEFMMCEVSAYSHSCDSEIPLKFRDGREHKVHLDELCAYVFPFGIVIITVKVSQQAERIQDILDALFMMRGICSADKSLMPEYVSSVLDPLSVLNHAAGNPLDYRYLMECGNKFRIFHMILCGDRPADETAFDALLYGGGTLLEYKDDDPKGFSRQYYESIMSGSRVSVFNNWKALSLLDTFTIVAHGVQKEMLNLWCSEYFGKLYLYALYRKFFLFRIYGDFRSGAREISKVRKDLSRFENDHTFPKVSYNFLPETLMDAMEKGLDVQTETVKVAEMIERENARREAETGDKMNLFLGVITCLTLFSAIWDFACLMDGAFEFSTNIGTATGIRACAMLLISVICISAFFVRRK